MYPTSRPFVTALATRYANRNMGDLGFITRPAATQENPDGTIVGVPSGTIYEGPMRCYNITGPVTYQLGEEAQYFSSSYISVPMLHPMTGQIVAPMIDDIITVTMHPDALVINKLFRVMDVESGGQFNPVRRMQVTGVQPSKQWAAGAVHPSVPPEWIP
jgi:hypothetical protein